MTEKLERRQHDRVTPKGTVVLVVDGERQQGRVSNVGISGMLAMTDTVMPEAFVGRQVDMELRLDGRLANWFQLSGKIVRITGESVAVTFDSVPPIFASMIDEVSTASHADRRVLSMVLIDATTQRRRRIAEGFRAAGCQVIDVATALEAIVRLGEASFEPELIAIADSVPGQVSQDLRDFVEREHPRAKLVTIGDEVVDPGGLIHWLSSADPQSDLAARVRHVLSRPRRK
ncbi:MAG: PilZ domain-containing protein [Myxococcota bacterium]|nr:PilZ domain-containing protein [Myxococcota bacterium]